MNQFELYCMIFYVLDAEWDETNDPQLGAFLSDANPFLFADIGSADPTVYLSFCDKIKAEITLDNSYALACEYVASLGNQAVTKAFHSIDKEEWSACLKDYLSQEQKGGKAE